MPSVAFYSLYHSVNCYLASVLVRRTVAPLPGVEIRRRPICVPRVRGLLVADLVGGKEAPALSGYHREDARRWADRHGIPLAYPPPELFRERSKRWALSRWEREELPARAYYAAQTLGQADALDSALFRAAWVEGLDVNEPDTVRWAAAEAGLDPDRLMAALDAEPPGAEVRAALAEFDRQRCPGVPTFVLNGARYFGKDRVDWLAEACRAGG